MDIKLLSQRYGLAVFAACILVMYGTIANAASGAEDTCTPAHEGLTTAVSGKLTIGVFAYPPFAYMDDGEAHGADADIIKKIADMECLDAVFKQGSFSAMIPNIKAGRLDTAIGSYYRTEPRSKIIRLGAPILLGRLSIVSKEGYSSLEDLKGLRVGSVGGFTFVEPLNEYLGGSLKTYPSNQAVFSDLKIGRIDAIMGTYASALQTMKDMGMTSVFKDKVLEETPVFIETTNVPQTNFPVSPDKAKLGKAFTEDIQTLKVTGELLELVKPYGFNKDSIAISGPRMLGCKHATITKCLD